MSRLLSKKILMICLVISLVISSFYGTFGNEIVSAAGNNVFAQFFVSPNGDDSNSGTYEQPFLTIERAQQAVREINKDMTGDIYVFVAPGKYYIQHALKFDEQDSGFNGHQVHYKSLGAPGSARLIGGDKFTGEWKLTTAADAAGGDYLAQLPSAAAGKVYKTKLDPEQYNFNELYMSSSEIVITKELLWPVHQIRWKMNDSKLGTAHTYIRLMVPTKI